MTAPASLGALLLHPPAVPNGVRAAAAAELAGRAPGGVLLATCQRVEWLGPADARPALGVPGARWVTGDAAARHVIRLAIGLESAVLGEDQVLHQLRAAVGVARATAPLDPALDRLLDLALRAGRRARSWLPARRPSLADVALDAAGLDDGPEVRTVLVVGAGTMGRLAVDAARARGADVLVASRTPARAQALARERGARAVSFDPGAAVLEGVRAVVLALAGPWTLGEGSVAAIARGTARVADLSAPPAVPESLAAALGARLVGVDDLAAGVRGAGEAALVARLEALAAETEADFGTWLADAPTRSTARALARRADALRERELATLWERVPELDPAVRDEVRAMAERLTERVLREPLDLARRAGGAR